MVDPQSATMGTRSMGDGRPTRGKKATAEGHKGKRPKKKNRDLIATRPELGQKGDGYPSLRKSLDSTESED